MPGSPARLTGKLLEQALALPGNDCVDNRQFAWAALYALDAVVTRDPRGLQATTVPVLAPAQLLAPLSA